MAAANQTVFVYCVRFSPGPGSTVVGTRIYRFHVTAAGRTAAYSQVPGAGFRAAPVSMTASANGAVLALDVPSKTGKNQIIVINVKTGAHAMWPSGIMPGGEIFDGWEPSLTANGKELAVFGRAHCPNGSRPGTCRSPGEEMRVVSPALAGGKLASGRMVFKESQLTKPSNGYINDALMDSGGTTVTAGIVLGFAKGSSYVEVLSASEATGEPRRVDFKLKTGDGFTYRFVEPDPSGAWVLFDAGPSSHGINGWIDRGKLVPLKPAGNRAFDEVWSS